MGRLEEESPLLRKVTPSPQCPGKRTRGWGGWLRAEGRGPRGGAGPTCVPELLVPIHRQDDQQVAQDVHHDGEDEDAGQRGCQPRGLRPRAVSAGPGLRGVGQRAAVARHGPWARPGRGAIARLARPPGHFLRLRPALPAPTPPDAHAAPDATAR